MKNLFLILSLFLPLLAAADWTKVAPTEFSLPPPPREGSATYKQDFIKLHEYQENRSAADCREARLQRYASLETFFGPKTGHLTEVEYAQTKPFLQKVFAVSERVSRYWKEQYSRLRPYDADTSLEPCVQKPGGDTSYPSSHTTVANTLACVIAEIYPDRAEEFRKAGQRAGELRMIVGVHHPSDVRASEKLAGAICNYLLADEDFQNSLRTLKE